MAELFDVTAGATIHRVFLSPGALQVDLPFAPAEGFAPRTPRFRLLFGEAGELVETVPTLPSGEFGMGVHHLIRAHVCIERNTPVQAEYWLHQARDIASTLACRRLGFDTHYGRGFDDLFVHIVDNLMGALAADLSRAELRRALGVAAEWLLRDAKKIAEDVERVREILNNHLVRMTSFSTGRGCDTLRQAPDPSRYGSRR